MIIRWLMSMWGNTRLVLVVIEKVVLYRNDVDGKHYAIKAFHKSHLLKPRVALSEAAMTDVLCKVLIINMLKHLNIDNLIDMWMT